MPRLGYVSVGWPLETPEEQETIRAPSHMTRKASYTLRVRGIPDQRPDPGRVHHHHGAMADSGQ